MEFLPLSFLAGILTILAPCILPLLPVIIGGSLSEQDKKRPLIITISLALSIIVFTLLLKVATVFINIPQSFWTWFSASIIFIFALTLLFPHKWAKLSLWFKQLIKKENKVSGSQKLLFRFHDKKGFWPAVILGAALGPIFASCSPTYFLILGTVLPAHFGIGLLNLVVYSLGLALVMFGIAYLGQRFTSKLEGIANPNGWFKKSLGVLFLVVAIGIAGGYDKKLSTYLLDNGLFDVTKIEERLLEKSEKPPEDTSEKINTDDLFNANVPAPDIVGLQNWINSDGYESLSELRGQVVLIDFWTYSCVNCIRTLPYLQDWHEKYAKDGLVILGIHAPEFAFEKVPENVQDAVTEYGITYPVVLDNDFATWRAYENRYWPAKYLIDRDGSIRYYHFGEGDYDETEMAITTLLDAEMISSNIPVTERDHSKIGTRETYLGSDRTKNFAGQDPSTLNANEWGTRGVWKQNHERVISHDLPSSLLMYFTAKEANLVMDGNATATIFIDKKPYKTITIDGPQLYPIFSEEDYGNYFVEIKFEGEWVEAFAWTFG